MVRILKTKTCPHCRAALELPTPRVCPVCGGSLQQRFFTAGCLSSAPPVILIALGALAAFGSARDEAAHTESVPAESVPAESVSNGARSAELHGAERAPARADEHVAIGARRP